MRAKVTAGFKPWQIFNSQNAFSFTLPWCTLNQGEMETKHLEEEWILMFDKWVELSLLHPFIEVFRTDSMGLGLRTREQLHLCSLANEIPGFFHVVEKKSTFRSLVDARHISLAQVVDQDGLKIDGVVYGPIDLINSGKAPRVQFTNFHPSGVELYWISSFHWGTETYRLDDMEITSSYCSIDMDYADLEGEFFPETRIELAADLNIKIAMIPRLTIEAFSWLEWENYIYEAAQEILVDYEYVR